MRSDLGGTARFGQRVPPNPSLRAYGTRLNSNVRPLHAVAALSVASGMQALKAGFAYFALVFTSGFILGAVRVPILVPRLGMRTAELLEAPVMLVAIFFAARFVVRRFSSPPRAALRLLVGAIALALLLLAEFALVVVVQRQALGAYVASRDPVSGTVHLAMLALFAAMPLLLRGRAND